MNEMNEANSMQALYEAKIAELQAEVTRLKERNRVLQASLNVGMGKTETNESIFGGPTPMDIVQDAAIAENGGFESENAKLFK